MALVNHATKEINAKIVYYGPEKSGKATSLRYVHARIRPSLRSELKSIPASGSPLLFFDFTPFEHLVFDGYRIRFHLYTLQGPVANPAAWKMTLKGADGLVIVMDATPGRYQAALQSLTQLRDFLDNYGMGLDDLPAVLQLNKADLSGELVADVAARGLGLKGCRVVPTNALTGAGVLETLSALSPLVMGRIGERDDLPRQRGTETPSAESGIPADTALERAVDDTGSGGGESAPHLAAAAPPGQVVAQVSMTRDGVRVEAGTVVIPLEVSSSQGVQRLTVTVMVAPAP